MNQVMHEAISLKNISTEELITELINRDVITIRNSEDGYFIPDSDEFQGLTIYVDGVIAETQYCARRR